MPTTTQKYEDYTLVSYSSGGPSLLAVQDLKMQAEVRSDQKLLLQVLAQDTFCAFSHHAIEFVVVPPAGVWTQRSASWRPSECILILQGLGNM
jgi:hypothetical protein